MKKSKTAKIDLSEARLARMADKYYNEGKYLSALRLAVRQYELFGGDEEVFARFSDIYEGMGLHLSAINWWYRYLDIAMEDELPDIYEGLAVNYLNLGNETQSAYYYNKLIDADDTLPNETKLDIIDAFAKDKKEKLRFVYPPKLADYSKEIEFGSRALKMGDCPRAIQTLSVVERGSKDYPQAIEMQAVAQLLAGNSEEAERLCKELLVDYPDDIRTLATLAAVYLEQGKTEESKALALQLYRLEQTEAEDLYKVATVCCENGLHGEAYQKFCLLEKKLPYDGRMLYFKAVAAFKCGKRKEAQDTLDTLCTVYPDAEVAKYYLKSWRLAEETGEEPIEPTYFYHLPQAEREERSELLLHMSKAPKDEAQLIGLLALHDGYFRWCFDEMDGGDHDLQYLAILCAERAGADEFLEEVLLDCEVADVLKIETLRMLYERNEEADVGLVLCHIYRRIRIQPIRIGRKKKKRFVCGYAKIASKFVVINDAYAGKLRRATEAFYKTMEEKNCLDLVNNDDVAACVIFLLSGLKELGSDANAIARAFDADVNAVQKILAVITDSNEEKRNEID